MRVTREIDKSWKYPRLLKEINKKIFIIFKYPYLKFWKKSENLQKIWNLKIAIFFFEKYENLENLDYKKKLKIWKISKLKKYIKISKSEKILIFFWIFSPKIDLKKKSSSKIFFVEISRRNYFDNSFISILCFCIFATTPLIPHTQHSTFQDNPTPILWFWIFDFGFRFFFRFWISIFDVGSRISDLGFVSIFSDFHIFKLVFSISRWIFNIFLHGLVQKIWLWSAQLFLFLDFQTDFLLLGLHFYCSKLVDIHGHTFVQKIEIPHSVYSNPFSFKQ